MKFLKWTGVSLVVVAVSLVGLLYAYVSWIPRGPELTDPVQTPEGTSSFVMTAYETSDRRTIRVWTHRPESWTPADPVLFVMHGMGRNADDYLDAWAETADAQGILVIAPEFENRFSRYVTADYQEGNVRNVFGAMNPESEWAFTVIENIVDELNARNDWAISEYDMFGHSAGSQFIQRMVMMKPEARIRHAIAANAGTYTFPDEDVPYPYGLQNMPFSAAETYATELTILLGENDNTADQGFLEQTDRAMAQGNFRLDRGQNLFDAAQADAEARDVPFAWQVQIVPGVGHNYRAMSDAAAELLATLNNDAE